MLFLHVWADIGLSNVIETIDGRKCSDKVGMSKDMQRINRNFSRNHAMAIHLNAVGMVATVWYGFALASKIRMVL